MQFMVSSRVRLEMAVFFGSFKHIVQALGGREGCYFVGVAVAKPERAGEVDVVVLDEAAVGEGCEVGGSFLDGGFRGVRGERVVNNGNIETGDWGSNVPTSRLDLPMFPYHDTIDHSSSHPAPFCCDSCTWRPVPVLVACLASFSQRFCRL